ncbi:hypothetical protein ACFLYD_06650, partial [Chloroflexota bacterium]
MFQYLAETIGLRLCRLAATIALVTLTAPSALPFRTAAQTPNCLKDVAGQNMNCSAGDVEIA